MRFSYSNNFRTKKARGANFVPSDKTLASYIAYIFVSPTLLDLRQKCTILISPTSSPPFGLAVVNLKFHQNTSWNLIRSYLLERIAFYANAPCFVLHSVYYKLQ